MEENVIVYMGTGCGKTHIAILLIYEMRHLIKKPQKSICIFLAPTVALVQQVLLLSFRSPPRSPTPTPTPRSAPCALFVVLVFMHLHQYVDQVYCSFAMILTNMFLEDNDSPCSFYSIFTIHCFRFVFGLYKILFPFSFFFFSQEVKID